MPADHPPDELTRRAAPATRPGEDASPVVCSVLVGLVSRREGARIFELLEALRAQRPQVPHEVIVADRLGSGVAARIAADFPEVRLIRCPAGTSLPALRASALAAARGTYAVVTEDHCVPTQRWLAEITAALDHAPADVAAVGGAVANGLTGSCLDRATFQCEYGACAPPVVTGPCDDLPGMNVAYVRLHLATMDRGALDAGFWETTVHPSLRERGLRLISSNAMVVVHRKHFGFGEFIHQRFLYSRHFAGSRYARGSVARRIAAFVLAPALPPILLWRFHRQAARRPRYWRDFLVLLPLLLAFTIVWALGEMAGYALGPGDALRELE